MALHELRHVEADDRLLVIEEEAGQLASQLRLTDAGWPEEDERADGPLRVLEAGACPPHRLGDDLDGIVLADQTGVDILLHPHQSGGLLLDEARHRQAGSRIDDLRDVLLIDLGKGDAELVTPLHLLLHALVLYLTLLVA